MRPPRRLFLAAAGAAALGAALGAAGCNNDVELTDPSVPSSATFWQSATDAEAGVIATYAGLLQRGTYQRWHNFNTDLRSDIGTAISPWSELEQYIKFQFPVGSDFEINIESWGHPYALISRANQVIARVPSIQMDTAQRSRIVGEAKFLRGLTYFNLISVYGGNIPLITDTVTTADRPASSDSAAIFAQIEKDLADAAAVLPTQTMAQSGGRATKGAAQGMLGKVQLQQRKWSQAAASLRPVVDQQVGAYSLVGDYGTLFRQEGNNGPESLFEVQMGNVNTGGQGIGGLNVSKMTGACGPTYCDGRPTRWYFQQFLQERTAAGATDPRLDATMFYYRGDTTRVYNRTWRGWRDSTDQAGRYRDTATVFWKKYGEYYTGSNDQQWEAQINYKVLRFADVLLMYAEALNEQNQVANAYPHVNRVRARAGLVPLPAGLSQPAMRDAILRERLLELGFEGQRWLDLGRHNLFADLAALRARDSDFLTFDPARSRVLPIPQRELNLNPNIRQNTGY